MRSMLATTSASATASERLLEEEEVETAATVDAMFGGIAELWDNDDEDDEEVDDVCEDD